MEKEKAVIKMRLDKPVAFDVKLKTELNTSNAEKREKGQPPQDQAGLIFELCDEAIAQREQRRKK